MRYYTALSPTPIWLPHASLYAFHVMERRYWNFKMFIFLWPLVSPPPKGKKTENGMNGSSSIDVFGSDPFFTTTQSPSDPFGMAAFGATNSPPVNGHSNGNINHSSKNGFDVFSTTHPKPQAIDNALHILDKKIQEMKSGFSRATINDDFSLDMLDPLRQTSWFFGNTR